MHSRIVTAVQQIIKILEEDVQRYAKLLDDGMTVNTNMILGQRQQAIYDKKLLEAALEQDKIDQDMVDSPWEWKKIDRTHPLKTGAYYLVTNGKRDEVAWLSRLDRQWSSSFEPIYYCVYEKKEVLPEELKEAELLRAAREEF